jgi:glycosyltransferase involved in cell wall biosynthesis
MSQADVLTVLSPENLKAARELFPEVRTELVLFGVRSDATVPPVQCRPHRPLRIASLGSDMHRDWQTLISVAESWPGCTVRIASATLERRLLDHIPNVAVEVPKTAREVSELYAWADVAVVPLKPNLHASGITVILEAVSCGVPVICTDTGGLRAYFSDDEVRYVAPGDPAAWRGALEEFAEDDHMRFALATQAQRRVRSADLTSRAFGLRHYELSQEIVGFSYSESYS